MENYLNTLEITPWQLRDIKLADQLTVISTPLADPEEIKLFSLMLKSVALEKAIVNFQLTPPENNHLVIIWDETTAQQLLNTKETFETLRQTVHYIHPQNTPVIISYSPAHLLKTPGDKKNAFVDLKLIKQVVSSY